MLISFPSVLDLYHKITADVTDPANILFYFESERTNIFMDVQLKSNCANRSDKFPIYIFISVLCSFVVWNFFC